MAWYSLALLTTLALVLGLVIAIPVDPSFPVVRGPNKSGNLEARLPNLKAKSILPFIQFSKKKSEWSTEEAFRKAFDKKIYKKKVFWSGNRFNEKDVNRRVSILIEVIKMIKDRKKNEWTIEMALAEEKLTMPPFDLKMNDEGSKTWENAMKIWANGAQGKVEVYRGSLREGNAYEEYEEPVLKELKKKGVVKEVKVYNLIEKTETLLEDDNSTPQGDESNLKSSGVASDNPKSPGSNSVMSPDDDKSVPPSEPKVVPCSESQCTGHNLRN